MRDFLLECAARAALIAFGTAAVLGVLRVKSAGARHAAWTGVMALMLVLPAWMAWGPRASLPVLPARPMPVAAAPVAVSLGEPMAAPAAVPPSPPAPWNRLAIVYFSGAFMLLARLAFGTLRARTLTSGMCAAPVTVGLLRPRVILPDNWRHWPQAQLAAVLVHEGEHMRRRDPLVQWLALLNRAIFWFHPLAWWLERRLSALAEEACDAAVLERGHDPHEYTSYLLALAQSVSQSGARLNAVGMAMPGSSLRRRVGQILSRGVAPRLSRRRAVSLAAGCAMLSAVFATASIARAPFLPDLPLPAAPPAAPIAKSNPPGPDPQAQRYTALYFDLDGSLPDMQTRANAGAIALVQQQTPGGLVSIMRWSNGSLKVIEDFTADHTRLIAGIGKLENNPSGDTGGVNGLLAATKILAAIPEKKSLVYFTMPPLRVSVSPEELRTVVGTAQQANVALFPIDVTGFVAGAQSGALIKAGDVLTLTLKDVANRPAPRGVKLLLTAKGKAALDSLNAAFPDRTFTVRPDGTIAIPGLGDVEAAGLTIEQLESTLGPALAARLSTPQFPITGVIAEEGSR